ncbi:MAG: hypothetical protein ACRDKB_13925 [Actinomycetota bacterium]
MRADLRYLMLGFVVIIASCTNGDDDLSGTDQATTTEATSTSASEETTTTLSEEDELIRDYQAAWDAFLAASDPPDPNLLALLDTHVGEGLSNAQNAIVNLQANGYVARGPVEFNPRVVSIDGDVAIVEDCTVDTGELYDAATGAQVSPAGPEIINREVRMERIEGTWRLALSTGRSETCTPA